MKRPRRSIWPARIEAGWRPPKGSGRPRGMSQADWFWMTPERRNPFSRWPTDGWGGGRDRDKPRKTRLHFHERGEWVGGVMGYEVQPTRWVAYVNLPDGSNEERVFGRRCQAKRWVEVRARRVRW